MPTASSALARDRGAFGAVYLGLNDDTGALMAVKELPFSLSDKKEIRKLSAEINFMRYARAACLSVPVELVGSNVRLSMDHCSPTWDFFVCVRSHTPL